MAETSVLRDAFDRLKRWAGRGKAKPATHDVGRRGEALAARVLRKKGYRVIGCNLPLRFTEVDILAEAPDRAMIVLVEVKTRARRAAAIAAGAESLAAEMAVDAEKRGLLVRAAKRLSDANQWHKRPMRIDVVAVELAEREQDNVVRHYEDVVERVE